MTIFIIVKLRYDGRPVSHGGIIIMKNSILYTSVIAGVIAATALSLSTVSFPIAADSLIGYAVVVTILAIGALEYGQPRKRPLSK
jgi:hypothetical protein